MHEPSHCAICDINRCYTHSPSLFALKAQAPRYQPAARCETMTAGMTCHYRCVILIPGRVASFEASKSKFLTLFCTAKYSEISWSTMFSAVISRIINPSAKTHSNMIELYGDHEALTQFEEYMGRLLYAWGKPRDDKFSLSSIIGIWKPVMSQATRIGAGMRADCLEHVEILMKATWAYAQAMDTSSLSFGTEWRTGLVDENFGGIAIFMEFANSIPEMRLFGKRFKNAVQEAARQQMMHMGWQPAKGKPAKGKQLAQPGGKHQQLQKQTVAAGAKFNGPNAAYTNAPGGWACHSKYGSIEYHVKNCQTLAKEKLNLDDQCILVASANDPSTRLGFCCKMHSLNAPEHQLYELWAQLKPFMEEGKHYRITNGRRSAAIQAGNLQPQGGKGGKGGNNANGFQPGKGGKGGNSKGSRGGARGGFRGGRFRGRAARH